MSGKILKILANDINGNVDDRKVVVFCAFKHSKYMNNYVVFAFEDELGQNKLCFGSAHLKKNSLVTFAVKNDIKTYIDQFLFEYENNNLIDFEILNIEQMEKAELVSYNSCDYDKIQMLYDISIPKIENKEIDEIVDAKFDLKTTILYILLVLLILLAIGITLVYLYPERFFTGNEELKCINKIYDKKLELYYDIEKDVKFNMNSKLKSIDVVLTYTFLDSNKYYEFRDNEKHLEYFNEGDSYKYNDDNLQLKIFYKENSVVDDYEEMLSYLEKEGFSCELLNDVG